MKYLQQMTELDFKTAVSSKANTATRSFVKERDLSSGQTNENVRGKSPANHISNVLQP